MAISPYERRSFSETAVATTLSGSITDSDLTCTIGSTTGWPTGASGDFYIRVENETIRVDTRSSGTLNFHADGRGANGTTAASHASGVAVTLVYSSFDADEANYAVTKTVGQVSAAGSLLIGDAANSLDELVLGSTGLPLVAGASAPGWTQLGTSGIADDAITSGKIAAGAVGSAEIADDAVGNTEMAGDAIGTAEIQDLSVTEGKIADLAVTTGKLAATSVTSAKLESSVVDDATLQFNSGVLRVKDAGISQAKFASGILPTVVQNAAPTGVAGQLWFDADDLLLYVYNGTAWVCVTPVNAVEDTSEGTTSTTYTNMAHSGPQVTVNTGTKALVTLTANLTNSVATTGGAGMAFQIQGATTVASSDTFAIYANSFSAGQNFTYSGTFYVTGLTAGANVFKAQYRANAAGTATFAHRNISAVGIP